MELKNTIRVERAKLGITQSQLAKDVGMSPQGISNIENGCNLSLDSAYRIAMYFKINITELFTLEN